MESFFDKSEENNEILYFSINQDNNSIAVGTKVGFKIFSTNPFRLFYEANCGPIFIIEMLHNSNIILLVGDSKCGDFSPRKVSIWSTSTNSLLCSTWSSANKIESAKINKKRMIIIDGIFMNIFNTQELTLLHKIEVGSIDPLKLVMSSNGEKNNYACIPKDEGAIYIYDLNNLNLKCTFKAHKSEIQRLAINSRGDTLASCSSKGTIIRIFSIPSGEKLFTFKRGLSQAIIYYINFSVQTDKIILSSDTGTLHVFELKKETHKSDDKNNFKGISSYASSFLNNIKSYVIPKDYEDCIGVNRSIISYNDNILKSNSIVSFNPKDENEAFCFTSQGNFHLFSFNYQNNSSTKINESNIKDLRLII